MKNILTYFMLLFAIHTGAASAQLVIDLSTGVYNGTTSLIPAGTGIADDTWTVGYGGTSTSIPSTYQSVYSSSSMPQGIPLPHSGLSANAMWVSPLVNAQGEYLNNTPSGYHYFRMTFENTLCATSADLNFATIGADDQIEEIIVNGYSYPVIYGYMPLVNGVSFSVSPSHLQPGTNEILIRVYNWGTTETPYSPMGMQIDGNLTIQGSPATPLPGSVNASFCLLTKGNSITATGSGSGVHTWEVYGSSSGNPNSYTHIGTYKMLNLNIAHSPAMACYLVKHTVVEECSIACESQSICNLSCDNVCALMPVPTGLYFEKTLLPNIFYWNQVPGAVSYEIEIIPYDAACCSNGAFFPPIIEQVSTNSYQPTQDIPPCFSWRVKAFCEDGSFTLSDPKCETISPGGGWGKRALNNEPGNNNDEHADDGNTLVNIYPNPTKAMVSFDITTDTETEFIVQVYDLAGKLVKSFARSKTSNRKASISWNTETISKGTYLVKIITTDNKTITRKLVVE